ncbi:hypothetical protein JVT61DRAFT_895 [Boletus reticuloceps]|uniref:Uncharacterized protein n=1 Tax=Boletus reticuloceps TaxID=495285 RepID=A0A8I2YPM4_9AGAM|nr:hypothetical protein JVT61DRAFT_895 [Boletus reticuloceps]
MGKNSKKIVQPEPDMQEEESDEQVALDEDDLEEAVLDEDIVPTQKVEINNIVRLFLAQYPVRRLHLAFLHQVALRRIRETIQLDPSLPWTETLVVSYPETIDVDVDDDLNRELAL